MRFNILGGLLPFKPREALKDVFPGLTLASMNIPQVLGYTRIAGVGRRGREHSPWPPMFGEMKPCAGDALKPRFPVLLILIVGTLPSLASPDVSLSETLALVPVAGSCFMMIIAQSAATSSVYGVMFKKRVDENADILGLAAANAAAASSGAFVGNGSPTQTAMAYQAGAKSQVAQLAFAATVFFVLMLLTYLPRCVLASIVFTIALGMADVQGFVDIHRESSGEF
jgi:MFS superfamily sulfate permease-like transporter